MLRLRLPLFAVTLIAAASLLSAQTREQPAVTAPPPAPAAAPAGDLPTSRDPLSTPITGARATLGPGDLIEISVFDTPELTQRVRVTSEGKIRLALIGEIDVGGMTAEGLRDLIAKNLIEGRFVKNPQVSIFIAEYAGQVAYVVGEINRPGAYPLLRSHRLLDLLSVAGGPTTRAGDSVTIARGSDTPQILYVSLKNKEEEQNNPEIFPGDRITVGEAAIVYVLGEVGKPGGFLIDRHRTITVLQALALAEGIQSSASIKKATLIRDGEQADPPMRTVIQIPINVEKVLKAENADIPVKSGDIIYVYGSLTRGLGRSAILTLLGTASTAAIYVAALH